MYRPTAERNTATWNWRRK